LSTVRPSDRLTYLGLLSLALIWGINFAVVKVGLEELDPLVFNALRFPLAAVALFVVLRARGGALGPELRDVPLLVGLGVLGNVAYQWLFIMGIDGTLAGNASIILATVPVWTALLSLRLGHERPGVLVWLGVAGTLAGMVLVVLGGAGAVGLGAETWRGDLLMLGAAVAWATYTVGSRGMVLRYGALRVTAWTVWVGTPVLLLIAVPGLLRTSFGNVSLMGWGTVVYAGFLSLAVAYVAWYRGVERIGSSRTAVYSNLVPVVALVTAWLWLGETPSPLQVLGAAIIIGGLTLTRLSPGLPPGRIGA
jgi:drug/metabolite transporter (DMT)-like permease